MTEKEKLVKKYTERFEEVAQRDCAVSVYPYAMGTIESILDKDNVTRSDVERIRAVVEAANDVCRRDTNA